MQFLIFILVYPIIWLLSILPFKVLYLISDFFYLLVYYIIGYRKKTVIYNLKLAFPQKSESEITIISKKFYQHLVDLFIEMIKSFTISEKEMRKRFKPTNIEVLQKLEMNKKSALLLGAHRSNWEWFFSINLYINSDGYCVYKKLKNKHFDKKILETRGKYGTTLVSTKEIFDTISYNYKNKILSF